MCIAVMPSPIGWLRIRQTGDALTMLEICGEGAPQPPETPLLQEACRQLEAYFAGRRQAFDLPLSFAGLPPFFQTVLGVLEAQVPFGKTVSYGQLAALCARPGAARAVGSAMGRNPLPILVPCHRVLPGDGRLGQYSAGGAEIKERLLALERRLTAPIPDTLLYHCSPTAGLSRLEPAVSPYFKKPRQVCLTTSLPMALFYGIRHFEYTYGYTAGGLQYEEYTPNALKRLYAGRQATLYACALAPGMEETQIPNEYVTTSSVPVLDCWHIPDLYQALVEQARQGALKIVPYERLSPAMLAWIRKTITDEILEEGLLARPGTPKACYLQQTYPDSWRDAERQANLQAGLPDSKK